MRVLLYYKYIELPEPKQEVEAHRALCERLGILGRILIAAEGINGTCCGSEEAIAEYKSVMNAHPYFFGINFKESEVTEQVFPRLAVKLRNELVTLRSGTSVRNAAPYITAEDLHTALEHKEDMVLIDMRNNYEADVGRFKGAVTLPVENFRDIPKELPSLEKYKHKKVVTYCTGGIRCEKASALLRENGFTNVYQLQDGIVTYMEKFPSGFFEGNCFVFDSRLGVRSAAPTVISSCTYCRASCDRYVDCREPGCSDLFICCEGCEKEMNCRCREHAQEACVCVGCGD